MPWIAFEPKSVQDRRAQIVQWEEDRAAGGDVVLGIWERPPTPGGDLRAGSPRLVGGTGLHRRVGPDGLEIGFWIHVDDVGRGLATRAARLATDLAFSVPGVEFVEIHHDAANPTSGRVAEKLGYTLAREVEHEAEAPAEIGIERQWRIGARDWPPPDRPAVPPR
jgi:RimJ/RimL family protein N-acetyltransferase